MAAGRTGGGESVRQAGGPVRRPCPHPGEGMRLGAEGLIPWAWASRRRPGSPLFLGCCLGDPEAGGELNGDRPLCLDRPAPLGRDP